MTIQDALNPLHDRLLKIDSALLSALPKCKRLRGPSKKTAPAAIQPSECLASYADDIVDNYYWHFWRQDSQRAFSAEHDTCIGLLHQRNDYACEAARIKHEFASPLLKHAIELKERSAIEFFIVNRDGEHDLLRHVRFAALDFDYSADMITQVEVAYTAWVLPFFRHIQVNWLINHG